MCLAVLFLCMDTLPASVADAEHGFPELLHGRCGWCMTAMTRPRPLAANHVWIVLNLALLAPLAWMLRRITRLSYSRILLVLALSFPLHQNLLYGQMYVVVLLLIVAACWCWTRGWQVAAGALVALAAGATCFRRCCCGLCGGGSDVRWRRR